MDRHDGLFYLAAAAGLAADHKAQGDRLDFGQLFNAYRDQFPFLVVAAATRIPLNTGRSTSRSNDWAKLGLQIERLPGGHLTTNEQPGSSGGFDREVRVSPERPAKFPQHEFVENTHDRYR